MNWKNIFSLLCSFSFSFLLVADASEQWHEAVTVFEKGDLPAARTALQAMDRKGYGPWRMLGAVAEQENDLPRAFIAYSRAQQEADVLNIADAVENMVRVKAAIGIEATRWHEYFKTVLLAIWPIFFQLIILAFWFIAMMLLRSRRRKFHTLIPALLISLLAIVGYRMQRVMLTSRYGVIVKDAALYIGPSYAYQERKKLTPGSSVFINEITEDGWMKVQHNAQAGWLSADVVEEI